MVLYDIFLWVRRSAFSLFLKNKNCNLFVLLCLKIHFGLFIFLQGNQTHWAFRSHDLCHDFRRHVHFQYHLHHFSIWIYPIVFLSVERKRRRWFSLVLGSFTLWFFLKRHDCCLLGNAPIYLDGCVIQKRYLHIINSSPCSLEDKPIC